MKQLFFYVYVFVITSYSIHYTKLYEIEIDVSNIMKTLGCEVKSLSGHERLELFHNTFKDNNDKFTFDYDSLFISDLKTKDFISPQSFNFTNKNTFEFGNKIGQVRITSYNVCYTKLLRALLAVRAGGVAG